MYLIKDSGASGVEVILNIMFNRDEETPLGGVAVFFKKSASSWVGNVLKHDRKSVGRPC